MHNRHYIPPCRDPIVAVVLDVEKDPLFPGPARCAVEDHQVAFVSPGTVHVAVDWDRPWARLSFRLPPSALHLMTIFCRHHSVWGGIAGGEGGQLASRGVQRGQVPLSQVEVPWAACSVCRGSSTGRAHRGAQGSESPQAQASGSFAAARGGWMRRAGDAGVFPAARSRARKQQGTATDSVPVPKAASLERAAAQGRKAGRTRGRSGGAPAILQILWTSSFKNIWRAGGGILQIVWNLVGGCRKKE